MKKIIAKTSTRNYPIFLGNNLFRSAPKLLKSLKDARQVLLVSNHKIDSIYHSRLLDMLNDTGLKFSIFLVHDGETFKNNTVCSEIYDQMLASNFHRTDINGLINCLKNKDFKWKSSQALVLGAGGAARSSIYGLLTKKIKKIYIYNRSLDRAKNIRKLFNNDDRIEIIKYLNNVNAKEINLIINCTPIGMTIDDNLGNKMPIPENWDLYGKFVVEMVYKPVETLLAVKAKKQKAVLINGWDILLSQAAFSFKIWFSQDNIPDTEEINKKLKKLIQNGGLHGFK